VKNIKSVNVLGQKVPIKHCEMQDGYIGLFWPDDNRIEINIDCPKEKLAESIVHEIGHAIIKRSGLDQTQISHDVQEIICDQFAKVITENFRLIKK